MSHQEGQREEIVAKMDEKFHYFRYKNMTLVPWQHFKHKTAWHVRINVPQEIVGDIKSYSFNVRAPTAPRAIIEGIQAYHRFLEQEKIINSPEFAKIEENEEKSPLVVSA